MKSKYLYQLLTCLLTVSTSQLTQANNDVIKLTQNQKNWATWGGNYAGTRYSTLDEINTKNVNTLQLAWTFTTGISRGHEGGPLIVGDIIYVHTPFPNHVYALDQKTRKVLWEYKPKQNEKEIPPLMCCDTVNRGLAYAEGKIFLQQADTMLVALDAKIGNIVWRVKNGDPKKGMTNTNAPIVVKDKVITGISGGEFGVRGFLAAYDINDGHLIWKGYSTGADKETLIKAGKTTTWRNGKVTLLEKDESLASWEAQQWKIGGGTTWGWYTYDPELNLIYYGSGNPGTWNPVQRKGDNKWTSALWARDADTGEVKWVYQMTPHDEWDFDGTNESVLVNQTINNQLRKTLVHFDKNGFAYTLDRETGELLVAEKFNKSVNWATHVDKYSGKPQRVPQFSPDTQGEDVNIMDICPSNLGAKNQQPVSYSPKTNLFYISGNHLCMEYEPFEVSYTAGQPYVGATLIMQPAGINAQTGEVYLEDDPRHSHLGTFTAWDATQGKIAWSISEPFSVWSGSVATAGGIVFYGTMEGYLKAVDAKTGQELYKFKTPSSIIGNVNTWRFQGKQYVGVLSGIGGWTGVLVDSMRLSNRVLSIFTLPNSKSSKTVTKTYPPKITAKSLKANDSKVQTSFFILSDSEGLGAEGAFSELESVLGLSSSPKTQKSPPPIDVYQQPLTQENYAYNPENEFLSPITQATSTFSIDVDTASYSNLRRFLNTSQLPPVDAIRIEEMLNYFEYDYPQPKKQPFSVTTELSSAPWQPQHQLLHIGLQGKNIDTKELPASNLVFLIDVSGSMSDNLELVKKSFELLVQQLTEKDTISIVVYAGAAGVVLPPTNGSKKQEILATLNSLQSGGSTAGGAGIKLAYDLAKQHFIKRGNNRVILATDGDFNVGVSSNGELARLIEEKREQGVFLSVIGFGQGNYQDSKMEQLADKGNGNYAYVDNIKEAKKVFIEQFAGTLWTIAKDVKLQLEFNPLKVKSYRLIGYENRHLDHQDFEDDKKDAGELGSGHSVTALYEIIPVKDAIQASSLKYQTQKPNKTARQSDELVTIKLRYKNPNENKSQLLEKVVSIHSKTALEESSNNFLFSAAIAEAGLLLRNSKFKANANYPQVLTLAKQAKGSDKKGYRAEFIEMMETAQSLKSSKADLNNTCSNCN